MVEKLERESAGPPPRSPAWIRGFAKVGRGVRDFFDEATLSAAFLGRPVVATGTALKHPSRIRWAAWSGQAERAGLDAIPIVAVTNFFIGAVIAFLGANLLTQFGRACSRSSWWPWRALRELAVLITAIPLAGRSASSLRPRSVRCG